MGTSPVSAMVVFVNGKPSKKDYRKYKIKTVVGPDDYASMREVIRRRYGRVQRDGLTPPDLIVIDGGTAHKQTAERLLAEKGVMIPCVSVVKDERHKPKDILGDKVQIHSHKKEILLANNEAHRFAITYHKLLRSKF